MSKDQPLLSQLMPTWQSTFTLAKTLAVDAMADDSRLLPDMRTRFNKSVHSAMCFAYLLDPLSWVANEEECGFVPNLSKVAAMETLFGTYMVKAAKEVHLLPFLPSCFCIVMHATLRWHAILLLPMQLLSGIIFHQLRSLKGPEIVAHAVAGGLLDCWT